MNTVIPNKFILIEGIDGSGKDTFTDFLVEELQKIYKKNDVSSISKIGQPLSFLEQGELAKQFVEDFIPYENEKKISSILKINRLACEDFFQNYPGIILCIRGLLTDLATLKLMFPSVNTFDIEGQTKIDHLVIIDVDTDTADSRISMRKIPRTWRENKTELNYFRDFYLGYTNEKIKRKTIIEAKSKDYLKKVAKKLAMVISNE